MGEYIPVHVPGHRFTATTSGAVTARQLVEVSGSGTVAATSGASAKWVGVAACDAPSGGIVTVYGRGLIHETLNSGGVTAGNQIVTAAAGKIAALAAASAAAAADINSARSVCGIALTTATDGTLVRWMEI